MEKHVKILGILYILRGALALMIVSILAIVLTGAGILSQNPTAFGILGLIAFALTGIIALFSIPSIVTGIGLLNHGEWARILALVIGCLSLIDIPIGTALGVYTLVILTDQEAMSVFTPKLSPGAAHA